MTDDPNTQHALSMIANRVRQNTLPAGISAALMLYFAFFSGGRYAHQDGRDAFALGANLFIYTIELGGIAMLAATLLSLTGKGVALAVDAAASVTIGVLLCLAAVMMLAGGGSGFLYLIFGVMFILAGIRNGKDWSTFSALMPRDRTTKTFVNAPTPITDTSNPIDNTPNPVAETTGSITDKLRTLRKRQPAPNPVPEEPVSANELPPQPPKPDTSPSTQIEHIAPPNELKPDDGPSPDGFLASFAPDSEDDDDRT
jgi:hypothetical protein